MIANLKSWKTSSAGMTQLLYTLSGVIQDLNDNDALTNPDWNVVMLSIFSAVGLLFAKDGDKTSVSLGLPSGQPVADK